MRPGIFPTYAAFARWVLVAFAAGAIAYAGVCSLSRARPAGAPDAAPSQSDPGSGAPTPPREGDPRISGSPSRGVVAAIPADASRAKGSARKPR